MNNSQMKWGVILSYILIILNSLFSLFITPYMIGCLGEAEYGVYKTISSFSASLLVLDMGLGNTVTRYIAKYRASGKDRDIPNFIAMSLIQALVMCCIIACVATPLYHTIDNTYAQTFSPEQIQTARSLLILLILNMLMHVFENVMNGVITGCNDFLTGNGIKVLRLLLRAALLIGLLAFFPNANTIVIIDIGVTILVLVFEILYVLLKLRYPIRLIRWENTVFVESGKYTLLMFLQNIAIQFNGNVDSILIGAMINTTSVTIYSMSLIIFGLYENLSTSISSVMLPSVMHMVENRVSTEKLQNWIEKVGRLQFMVLAAALGGFIVLGREFYALWRGELYKDCYALTLILIIPVTLPMLMSTALSILRAQNKMVFRTVTLFVSCLINILISIIGIRKWGYWGAALGTAAYSILNFIFMGYYYHIRLKFRILQMLSRIFARTIWCAAIASAVTALLHQLFNPGWPALFAGAGIYLIVYCILMLIWGLNSEEKIRLHIPAKRCKL